MILVFALSLGVMQIPGGWQWRVVLWPLLLNDELHLHSDMGTASDGLPANDLVEHIDFQPEHLN